MRYKHSLAFFLILLCFPSYGHAQLWSGILASSRATDWTKAGVKNGIPSGSWTQCGSTIAAYTGNASTINSAISSCGANHYVQLGAGTFTLSSGIQIAKSSVALRGMGADQTFIVGNGTVGCGSAGTPIISACGGYPGPYNTANWTVGYSQGTTSITINGLCSGCTAPTTGTIIILDQLDDASDGWPSTGDIYVCQVVSSSCSDEGGGGNSARSGRAETELHEITSITGSGSGPYTVTITPPISNPNWRSGQSPGVYWAPSGIQISNVGIENLSVDWTNVQGSPYTGGISMSWCKDCWIEGSRVIDTASTPTGSAGMASVLLCNTLRTSVLNNYVYGPADQPTGVGQISVQNVGSALIQNNIVHQGNQPILSNGPMSQTVIAYNWTDPGSPASSGQETFTHGAGEFMDLWEGNISSGFAADSTHGSHLMQTVMRGLHYLNPSSHYDRQVIFLAPNARFMNVVGSVLGDPTYLDYQANEKYNDNAIYSFGFTGCCPQVNYDSNVLRTIMRWGNWDYVTNAVRWCGNSSDTGRSTTCRSTSEVPSGITNFANPVPTIGDTGAGQGALPASFYLSSKPSWWVFPSGNASTPWPGIGPDVTGGNIANTAGHAYLNPAGNCYLNVMGGSPGGGGSALSFNAGKCYPPTPPTDVEAVAD